MQYIKNMKNTRCIRNVIAIQNVSGMKETFGVIILLFLFILLTGCSSTGKHSDCHLSSAGPDGKCDSVSLINATKNAKDGDKFYGYPINSFEGKPIRKGENVQQIWIGPYEDSDGNYHEPSYVYSVIKKGIWIGEPVKEIQD